VGVRSSTSIIPVTEEIAALQQLFASISTHATTEEELDRVLGRTNTMEGHME